VNLDIYEWLYLVIKMEIIKNRSMTKKLPFPSWSWQHSAIRRQFNLENLTTNSTLKQSKSIEISKDLVLILQIYNIYETKGREESPAFLEKKKDEELTKGGTRPSSSRLGPLSWTAIKHPLLYGGTTTGGLGPLLPSAGPRWGWRHAGLLPPAGP
jgi:hypothetical protein